MRYAWGEAEDVPETAHHLERAPIGSARQLIEREVGRRAIIDHLAGTEKPGRRFDFARGPSRLETEQIQHLLLDQHRIALARR